MLQRFKILVRSVYKNTQIKVEYAETPRPSNSKIERLIKTAWEKKENEAHKNRSQLFSKELCRLISYKIENRTLSLTLGPTTYKELIGTNVHNPWIYSKYGPEFLSNALGVSALVVTSDGKLVFGRRRSTLAFDPGKFDVCGGFIRPEEDLRHGLPNPFAAIRSRVQEALGIPDENIENVTCLGLMQNFVTLKPELTFEMRLSLSSGELKLGQKEAPKTDRLSAFIPIDNNAKTLKGFFLRRRSKITYVSQACIWMYATRHKYWATFEDIRDFGFLRRTPPKTALVLAGGFAKGFAHIGVFKVLEEIGMQVDFIVGNSIGGLMGAAYASKMSWELCEEEALNFEWKMVSDWVFPKWGLLKGDKLEEYIRRIVTYDKFSDLQIPLAVVTSDLASGEEVVFCNKELANQKKVYDSANPFFVFGQEIATNLAYDYKTAYEEAPLPAAIRATCSFPGIFQPVKIGERLLVDGIINNNIPVKIARRLGAEFIIAVDLSFERAEQGVRNIFDVILLAQTLQSDKLARFQLKGADVVIRPSLGKYRFNDFKDVREILHAGEVAARELIPVIKSRWVKKSKFGLLNS